MSFVERRGGAGPCLALAILALSMLFPFGAEAQKLAERTVGFQKTDGFIPFYWDAKKGRVLLQLTLFDEDVLYYVSAATSPGSVEMPLDRGILNTSVIRFERSGPKVLVVEQNLKYRALDGTPMQAARTWSASAWL